MKKLLLICCILIGISTISRAQGGGGRTAQTAEQQVERLKAPLGLTDEQTVKIRAIYVAQTASRDSLERAGGDRSAMRPLMMSVTAKIKAVLTPEQADKFDKLGVGGGARPYQGGAGGGGGTPPPPKR